MPKSTQGLKLASLFQCFCANSVNFFYPKFSSSALTLTLRKLRSPYSISALFTGGGDTKICSLSDKKCYKSVEENFLYEKKNCGCKDQCKYLSYKINMKRVFYIGQQLLVDSQDLKFYPLIREKAFDAFSFLGSVGGLMGLFAGISVISVVEFAFQIFISIKGNVIKTRSRAKVHAVKARKIVKSSFYFGGDAFVAYKRYETYGRVALLSNIGGLLGLFLGISLLSVIEIIYFFTLRFIDDFWRKKPTIVTTK